MCLWWIKEILWILEEILWIISPTLQETISSLMILRFSFRNVGWNSSALIRGFFQELFHKIYQEVIYGLYWHIHQVFNWEFLRGLCSESLKKILWRSPPGIPWVITRTSERSFRELLLGLFLEFLQRFLWVFLKKSFGNCSKHSFGNSSNDSISYLIEVFFFLNISKSMPLEFQTFSENFFRK